MSEDAATKVTVPFAFYEGRIPTPAPGKSEILEHTSERTGATMSTGLVTFSDLETAPWTVWYDEVLGLHSLDGEFEMECDGKRYPMKVGDFVWVRSGTTVIYRARGSATLFYAVTPADWVARGRPS
jgi:ethanolamine utilization protein EutQ (cupin superfamily)